MYVDCLIFSDYFPNGKCGLYGLVYYLAAVVLLEQWQHDAETYIYWVLEKSTVVRHEKLQNLNINKSYLFSNLMQIEGTST